MKELTIYENYGALVDEKRSVYTFGAPHSTAVAWEKLKVQVPDGWEATENEAGSTIIISPWGWNYTVNELLIGDKGPVFYAVDDKQKAHHVALRITEKNVM